MFQEFQRKSEQNKEFHRNKILSSFIFVFAGFITFGIIYTYGSDYLTERQKEINRTNNVTFLCRNLTNSEPSRLFLVSSEKVPSGQDSTTLSFYYLASGNFDEIMPIFLKWFEKHNFKPENESGFDFKNGNQSVFIRSTDKFKTNYQIYCRESELSFGIYD